MKPRYFNTVEEVVEFLRADPAIPIELVQEAFREAGAPTSAGRWKLTVDDYKEFDEVFCTVGNVAFDDAGDEPAVQVFGLGGRVTISREETNLKKFTEKDLVIARRVLAHYAGPCRPDQVAIDSSESEHDTMSLGPFTMTWLEVGDVWCIRVDVFVPAASRRDEPPDGDVQVVSTCVTLADALGAVIGAYVADRVSTYTNELRL